MLSLGWRRLTVRVWRIPLLGGSRFRARTAGEGVRSRQVEGSVPLKPCLQGPTGVCRCAPWTATLRAAVLVLGLAALPALAGTGMNLGPMSLGTEAAGVPADYNLRLGNLRLGLTGNMAAQYDDNVDRTHDEKTGAVSAGPGLGLGVYWPVSPYVQIQTGAGLTYWYSTDEDALEGLEVTGLDGGATDATISLEAALHKHLRLRLSDSYSHSSDKLALASRGVPRSSSLSNNETALQADMEWTKRITTLTRFAHEAQWAGSSTFDRMDLTRDSVNTAALWRLNRQLQMGPYGDWQGTTYSEDKHNDSQAVGAGLAVAYASGGLNVTTKLGLSKVKFSDSNVPGATDGYTGMGFGASLGFATSKLISHTLSVDYGPTQGTLDSGINFSKDLTTSYGVSVSLRPRLTVSGTLAWVNSRQSDGGENANTYQAGVGVSYELTKRVSPRLSYQQTRKTSDVSSQEYVDNLVALSLSYRF